MTCYTFERLLCKLTAAWGQHIFFCTLAFSQMRDGDEGQRAKYVSVVFPPPVYICVLRGIFLFSLQACFIETDSGAIIPYMTLTTNIHYVLLEENINLLSVICD